ncbi:MAG: M20/M25/M40 family metallo-hydrolase [candidate division KSB1 bacterium]|nr:M20/M25/M40 family metallo-hydrolase [candidate division KSB1 bacterium]MDZ7273378.1 M20/M25/M40 family metallo-hydrolase [candidate division KSB1 bacterium]MDZ7288040.1 M20/M25/M40 family metallo-hydrolase [candidate division KSB1 bacterium]MDZ7300108.1 M20/M25/M40 family metallo-hydrolase [candidate division KSB1 bacterium]MDZ7308933.1 M20/M25/M40 family metallo-hydrolase [candidate division KSB1 bacterium]
MPVRMIVCGAGLVVWFAAGSLCAQQENARPVNAYQAVTQQILSAALREGRAYAMLVELTRIGPRLSGSPQAAAAVELTRQMMERYGFENVRLQPVMVPRWVRGPVEEAAIINSPSHGTVPLAVCALGSSIATPAMGVVAEVVEVKSFEELRALGRKAAGRIIFFNRPMDPTLLDTFAGYGGAVNQRSRGAVEAAKAGGVAALVRSLTTANDDVPHTGNTHYEAGVPAIPVAALSTAAADLLSRLLAHERSVTVRLRLTCETQPDVPSANVMGELRGVEQPEEIIVLGGHLDSWDKGTGAHDDGAGCVQAIEAVRLLKQLGFRPKRTIRAVMFMNEENGLRGAQEYARVAVEKKIKHVAAIESDRGGFAPRGFSIEADSSTTQRILSWREVFAPLRADHLFRGGSGADISPLVKTGVPGLGLIPESQRYFDYHHSDNDTIDKVNPRELELGAAAMAIMAYLLSEEL